jgi:hypothetical protein
MTHQPQVTIWTRLLGAEAVDGEREELDSWSNPYALSQDSPWSGAGPVEFAVSVIQAEGCDAEPSSYPEWGGPHTWYSGEPFTGFRDGTTLEKSAHLHGFTEAQQREIYARLTQRQAEPEPQAQADDYRPPDVPDTSRGLPAEIGYAMGEWARQRAEAQQPEPEAGP